jgi:hypothetical protein
METPQSYGAYVHSLRCVFVVCIFVSLLHQRRMGPDPATEHDATAALAAPRFGNIDPSQPAIMNPAIFRLDVGHQTVRQIKKALRKFFKRTPSVFA